MQILLADDQAKVRSALRLLLTHEPDIEILDESVDSTGVLDWLRAANPDAILLDWELPGLPTETLLHKIRSHSPDLWLIALSGLPEAHPEALAAGAHALDSKGDPPEILVRTIHACTKQETPTCEEGRGHDQLP